MHSESVPFKEPAQQPHSEWNAVHAGSWFWRVNPAYAKPGFLQRLHTAPDSLPGSEAKVIKAHPRTGRALVSRVSLPEFPELPLVVKRYVPRGIRQPFKDWFRRSRAFRAMEWARVHEQHGIPTPRVLAAGERRSCGWLREACLITTLVPGAETLHDLNPGFRNRNGRVQLVRAFARLIAALHQAGFSHTDPSLSNFLVSQADTGHPGLIVIDLDGLRHRGRIGGRLAALDLHRLLHRSAAFHRERLWFLAEYARTRRPRVSSRNLASRIGPAPPVRSPFPDSHNMDRQARNPSGAKRDDAAGTLRRRTINGLHWTLVHGLDVDSTMELLSNPDAFLKEPGNLIKNSRNVTIGRLPAPMGGGEWILRRLNYGKRSHQWRDMFRSGRAPRALKNAFRLERAGVRTPRALAATEVRLLRWPRRAYLVTEAVSGARTLEELVNENKPLPRQLVNRLAGLLARLHRAGYSHRDLKATNVLIDHQLQPWLIDLDGIQPLWIGGRRRRLKDLARLAGAVSGHPGRWWRTVLRFWICYCREMDAPRDARRLASQMEKALKRL